MYEVALKKAIAQFGSMSQLARKLGVRRENISAWLNRNVNVPLEYAFRIDRLTQGEVSWQELVQPHIVRLLKECVYSAESGYYPIESLYVSLSRIQKNYSSDSNYVNQLLLEGIKSNGLQNPIGIDEKNNLIFGKKRLCAYEALGKKTIPAWRLSLEDLLNNQYSKDELSKLFSISERVAIGLAVENFLGNRRGHRTDLIVSQNVDEVKGRTDELIADCLNFGNRQTYHQAKKIKQLGCSELVEAVDAKQISISNAAKLAKLTPSEQLDSICLRKKKIKQIADAIKGKSKKLVLSYSDKESKNARIH